LVRWYIALDRAVWEQLQGPAVATRCKGRDPGSREPAAAANRSYRRARRL